MRKLDAPRSFAALLVALAACLLSAVPAQAAYPGQNGKLAFHFRDSPDDCNIATINADGTGFAPFAPGRWCQDQPTWSPDGKRILVDSAVIDVMDADGSNREFFYDTGGSNTMTWSPDGTQAAVGYTTCGGDPQGCASVIHRVDSDGSGTQIWVNQTSGSPPNPSWSPDGRRIAFNDDRSIWLMDPDGTNLVRVPNTEGAGGPDWAPDGSRIAFGGSLPLDPGIHTIRPDGTGLMQVTFGPGSGWDPAWSPDGTRIAFVSNRDPDTVCSDPDFCNWEIYTVSASGGDEQRVTTLPGLNYQPDWQPLPINSYPRPKGATPLQVYLVPAYEPCLSPNRTHGPPLAFGSCHPPTQESGALTVGTADSNAKPTRSISVMRFDTLVGNPATPADEADVQVSASITDVYEQGSLVDYAGDVQGTVGLRITDKLNTPHPGGPGAGTVADTSLGFAVPCAPTADTTVGASCAVTTTVDALIPGAVTEGRRSIWALGQVTIEDAGGAPFMRQGIFIP